MYERIKLIGQHDQAPFGAFKFAAQGDKKGGIVLLHEIFGVDANMQQDAARWAALGYDVVAPSLFDRETAGFCASRDSTGIARGMACLKATSDAQALGDIAACVDHLHDGGPVALIGYCYGGRLAWLGAARLAKIAAAVTYYGNVLPHMSEAPQCPVMLHFGGKDAHLPVADIGAALRQHHAGAKTYIYPESGHGFNNADAEGASPADREQARQRTASFLADL